jgi:hypothetical protein
MTRRQPENHPTRSSILTIVAVGLALSGCLTPSAKETKATPPAALSKVPGTEQVRLTLSKDAAKRLDVTTAPVRRASRIGASRRYSGEVISVIANLDATIVRIEMPESDRKRILPQEPAIVLPLGREDHRNRIQARSVQDPTRYGLYPMPGTLYYETKTSAAALVVPQLVFVELALSGGEAQRVVPYSAVLYDPHGGEWVYTSPEPLVFVRQPIKIGSVVGDDVVLVDGPPEGTPVVTVGAAELYGAEFGVGK